MEIEDIRRKKRTWEEKKRDLAVVADMHLKGYSGPQIAEVINAQYPPEDQLSVRRINLDIKEIIQDWNQQSMKSITELRAEQLEKLRGVEEQLWKAWEESKKVKEIVITEVMAGGSDESGAGRRRRVQTRREQSVGDPRFLQGILEVVDKRSKLLGLNEPAKVQLSVIQEMKNDELEDLIRELSTETLTGGIIEGQAREIGDSFGGGKEAGNQG